MALKGKGYGHRQSTMEDRTRIVVYFEQDEKEEIQEAARRDRLSVSAFAASAVLREARRNNMEREILALRKKSR